MTLDRRHLLTAAAATGFIAAAPKPPGGAHMGAGPAAAPGDAAINRYFDTVSDYILSTSPENATGLGLDTGKRAALNSRSTRASGVLVSGATPPNSGLLNAMQPGARAE